MVVHVQFRVIHHKRCGDRRHSLVKSVRSQWLKLLILIIEFNCYTFVCFVFIPKLSRRNSSVYRNRTKIMVDKVYREQNGPSGLSSLA